MNNKIIANAIAKSINSLDSICMSNHIEDVRKLRRSLFEAMLVRGYVFASPNSSRTRAVTKKDHSLWAEMQELIAKQNPRIVVEVSCGDGCSEEKFTERLSVAITEDFPKARFLKDWEACKVEREAWSTNELINDMREIGWIIEPMDDITPDISVDA